MVVLEREKGRTGRRRSREKMVISRVRVGLGEKRGVKGGGEMLCVRAWECV